MKCKNILLLLTFVLLVMGSTLPSAEAAVLLSSSFEGPDSTGGLVRGGEFVTTPFGQAWISGTDFDPNAPGYVTGQPFDVVTFQVKEGEDFLSTRGTIRVLARNYRTGGPEYDGPDVNYNTLFAFLGPGGERLLVAYVVWNFPSDAGVSGIMIDSDLPEIRDVWGTWLPFDRRYGIGEWADILISWGGEPQGTEAFAAVNGWKIPQGYTDLAMRKPASPSGAQLTPLVRAEKLLVGSDVGYKNPEEGWFPSYNTLIDRLVIEDVVYPDPSVLYPQPGITGVSHDAFSVAGYSGQLVPGDVLTVRLNADPGGKASFDIIQPEINSGGKMTLERVVSAGMAMVEDPDDPGTYTGTYTVKYGDMADEGKVVGYFTSAFGGDAAPASAYRTLDIDGTVHLTVTPSNDLIPADKSSRSGLTVTAADANGKAVRDHELKLTLSTTDEYTGTVGGGSFEDLVGGKVDVDWGGVTDSFGEVTAQYVSGFAAKTILVSAKDMVSGDVGVGWVRSFIDGTVDIVVTEPAARALAVAGSMDVSLSRDWLTADGRSRSRITAVVKDASGEPLSGHSVRFTLLGDNGAIRTIQGKTDSRGRAIADYIAGTVMGQVQVEVRDLTSGMVAVVPIELRPDAPAEIILVADPPEVVTGGQSTVSAKVTDANGNANHNVDVLYNIMNGEGALSSKSVATNDKGVASAQFTASGTAGLVTVRGTVISREPTADEISAAEGAVFLYGLAEDPSRLEVIEWLVKPGDEVLDGQDLVTLEARDGTVYTVVAPRDGAVSTFTAEERDRVEYGDTLGYVIEIAD